ncbi:type I-F CRISPR-associated helicase Cas3f [Colwellia sp. KU-HH00111]|uniref:type I-F CRISPR-associated helicase Cas3f n=1 Tax=Colwellia sp. KU-HH00111 TaxID=3127652 RepID=UPI00310B050D
MMVTFVSQCEKNALKKTRRVLDAFANRIGDNTWQTIITEDGLITVKRMLRQTASKSTAVSCHWIRSRSRSQFLWVVGNKSKFNEQGIVPVNYTEKDMTEFKDSASWKTLDVIASAAAIAGLFHDFGKANVLFQNKINPDIKTENSEPYRHEWVSLRLFQAFVNSKNDAQWLEAIAEQQFENIQPCFKDGVDQGFGQHPISSLSPFAQLVAWIIVSHHKLPLCPAWQDNINTPHLKDIDKWLIKSFDANWNSYHCNDDDQKGRVQDNWFFAEKALPYYSKKWCSQASNIASKAQAQLLKREFFNNDYINDQIFTSHLARLAMMLADRYYSSQPEVTTEWRGSIYHTFANTYDKLSGKSGLKQQLDEHLIGVAINSRDIVNALPRLKVTLPKLDDIEFLSERIKKSQTEIFENYGWQNNAQKLASKLGSETLNNGFFGINMASTGKGKTIANAKIMYAIGEQTGNKRFSIALGLRTLTLQTGREFKDSIGLNDEKLAIAVGGSAVKQLFENAQNQTKTETESSCGSESAEENLNDEIYTYYRGETEHSLSKWTAHDKNIDKLLSAPVLVCTIDHLISATEGTRGGRQTAAMLRLLSSDLVLDEPDDFGLSDLPALCRLVNWAGMLGSRVLLSTATMPPALVFALYESYRAGWQQYAKANLTDWSGDICCAWFDENKVSDFEKRHISDLTSFKSEHNKFVQDRISFLSGVKSQNKQLGKIADIKRSDGDSSSQAIAKTIYNQLGQLHDLHHTSQNGKTVSIGLVRMANINPLVSVAKQIMSLDAPAIEESNDCCIHLCIYHSRYPLAIRSAIENQLDTALKRKNVSSIFDAIHPVGKVINKHPQKHHIFVVLASPVAEVGRDHDYDWAIVEPSSMRSIIQIAGRVLRHREKPITEPNMVLLNQNYKALSGSEICFTRPGFEMKTNTEKLLFAKPHCLNDLLPKDQYEIINAVPRITLPEKEKYHPDKAGFYIDLNGLEHKALAWQLFSGDNNARVWWNVESKVMPYWCGEVQRQQRFRQSQQDEAYYLMLDDEFNQPYWRWFNENVRPAKFGEVSEINISSVQKLSKGKNIYFWFDQSPEHIYQTLSDELNMDLSEIGQHFGELRITEFENSSNREYCYHNNFGMYQEVNNDE